ncbi:GDSL-type esterase/lipase family protein [Dokdonia sp.]|uniref:GDSL-type esterase/lipase family protein n=1 Tax=Dokdonia sp. TaxID=2024995 RepID=UPI0032672471
MKILSKKNLRPIFVRRYVILLIASFIFLSCSNEDDLPEKIEFFQILSIGDSRVEGHETDFVSYRYELWKLLKSEDKDVDFLGTRIDERIYPNFQDTPFDTNHEGKGGDKTNEVLGRLDSLIVNNPDMIGNVALLGIGGNDLVQGVPVDNSLRYLNLIIDKLQETNASMTIFIEKIAPGTTSFQESSDLDQARYIAFNNAISDIAINKTTLLSRVVVVDMSAILTDEDYADNVHYNQLGAQKVANQYFDAMQILF